MVLYFEKCELNIDEFHKDEISSSDFVGHESDVIKLIQWWYSKQKSYTFQTSGSTGHPKRIEIGRHKIEYSISATHKYLDPDNRFKNALLAINPAMIGGAMVVFRALANNLDLTVVKPSTNPLAAIKSNSKFDLVSLVPMQLDAFEENDYKRFKCILVGGAAANSDHSKFKNVYYTFGMTETVSHFALRRADKESYYCTGDTQIVQRDDEKLEVHGSITNNEKLLTNDIVEFISSVEFKWLGRADFVINSGGVKMYPELIEAQISDQLNDPAIFSWLEDKVLGQKLILVIESNRTPSLDFSKLDKFHRPKEVYCLPSFLRTKSGKVDRIKTRDTLISQLKK